MYRLDATKINVFADLDKDSYATAKTIVTYTDETPDIPYDRAAAQGALLARASGHIKGFVTSCLRAARDKVESRTQTFLVGKVKVRFSKRFSNYLCHIYLSISWRDEAYVPYWFIVFVGDSQIAVCNMGFFDLIDGSDPVKNPFRIYDLITPIERESESTWVNDATQTEEDIPWMMSQYKFEKVGRVGLVPFSFVRTSKRKTQITLTKNYNLLRIGKKLAVTNSTLSARYFTDEREAYDPDTNSFKLKTFYTFAYPLLNGEFLNFDAVTGRAIFNINSSDVSRPLDKDAQPITEWAPAYIQKKPRFDENDTIDDTVLEMSCGTIKFDFVRRTLEAEQVAGDKYNEFYKIEEDDPERITDPLWSRNHYPTYPVEYTNIVSSLGAHPEATFDAAKLGPSWFQIEINSNLEGGNNPNYITTHDVQQDGEAVYDPEPIEYKVPRYRQMDGFDVLDYVPVYVKPVSKTKVGKFDYNSGYDFFFWNHNHEESCTVSFTRDFTAAPESCDPDNMYDFSTDPPTLGDTRERTGCETIVTTIANPTAPTTSDPGGAGSSTSFAPANTTTANSVIRKMSYCLQYQAQSRGYLSQYKSIYDWHYSDINFLVFPPNFHPGEDTKVYPNGATEVVLNNENRTNRIAYNVQDWCYYYEDASVKTERWYAENIPKPVSSEPEPPAAGTATSTSELPGYTALIGSSACPSVLHMITVGNLGSPVFSTVANHFAVKPNGLGFDWDTRQEALSPGAVLTPVLEYYQHQVRVCGQCVPYDLTVSYDVYESRVDYTKTGYIDFTLDDPWNNPIYTTETFGARIPPWYWHTAWYLAPTSPSTLTHGFYLPYTSNGNLAAALEACPEPVVSPPAPTFDDIESESLWTAKANTSYGATNLEEKPLSWVRDYNSGNGGGGVESLEGWLHISNGRHVLQGYRINKNLTKAVKNPRSPDGEYPPSEIHDNPDYVLYKDGKSGDILPILASLIGCDIGEIKGMLLDIPEKIVTRLTGKTPT